MPRQHSLAYTYFDLQYTLFHALPPRSLSRGLLRYRCVRIEHRWDPGRLRLSQGAAASVKPDDSPTWRVLADLEFRRSFYTATLSRESTRYRSEYRLDTVLNTVPLFEPAVLPLRPCSSPPTPLSVHLVSILLLLLLAQVSLQVLNNASDFGITHVLSGVGGVALDVCQRRRHLVSRVFVCACVCA